MKKVLKFILPIAVNTASQAAKDAIDAAAVNRKYAYLHELKPIINGMVECYKAKLPAIGLLNNQKLIKHLLLFVLGLLKDAIHNKETEAPSDKVSKLSILITSIEAYLKLM